MKISFTDKTIDPFRRYGWALAFLWAGLHLRPTGPPTSTPRLGRVPDRPLRHAAPVSITFPNQIP